MSLTKKFQAALIAIVLAAMPVGVGLVALNAPEAAAQAADAPKPAEAAPAAKAPAAPGAVSKETVDNPYGLKAMWDHGDWVSKGVLFLLVIMSMGSWYILVVKFVE